MPSHPGASWTNAWGGVRVGVTGASGFIGSHLVEALANAGARVRALTSYRAQREIGALRFVAPGVLEAVELHRGDVRDPDATRRFAHDCEVIFHLAALVAIPYSYANPRVVFEVNLTGALNVALAARDAGVRRLVHTSTSEVYGTALQVPITEEHPIRPHSPYAASKAAADNLVISFGHSYELPATIVRPFNTYGPRQSTRAVLPTIVWQALAGNSIRLGSLDPRRDMTFVADTVAGLLAAGASEKTIGETMQLGTGKDYSVRELIAAVEDAVGRELVVEQDETRLRPARSEVMRLISNPARMQALTGWTPTWTLEDGIAELVAWAQQHLGEFDPTEYAT